MATEMEHGASLHRDISRAMVRLTHEYTGRGPRRAHTTIRGITIICVLEDTLTKGERCLADLGNGDAVLEMRHQFQDAMRDEAVSEVERLCERRVVAFMSTNHIDPDLAAEIFILDAPVGGVHEATDLP